MKRVLVLAVFFAFAAAPVAAQAADRDKGTLKVAGKGMAMELEFPGKVKLVVTSKGKKIPARTYTPTAFTLMKKTRSGRVWKLKSSGRTTDGGSAMGPVGDFEVTKDEETVLDVGAPLKIRAIIYRRTVRRGKTTIPIGYSISGKAGEFYHPNPRVGSRRVPAPVFQIVDEKKKVLAQGKFEYG